MAYLVARLKKLPFYLLPIILGAFVSLHSLGSRSLWLDEILSLRFASSHWENFWEIVSQVELNMVLYTLFLRFWITVGSDEFILRLPSALFGIASIPFLHLVSKRLFDDKVALAASLLFSTNVFFVRYSQEARAYSLFMLFSLLSTHLFLKLLDGFETKTGAAYVASVSSSIYIHFFSVFIPFVHCLSLIIRKAPGWLYRKFIIRYAVCFVLSLPFIFFLATHKRDYALSWVPRPSYLSIYELLKGFSGKLWPVFLLLFIMACLKFVIQQDAIKSRIKLNWEFAFTLLWFFAPILMTFIFSYKKPIFVHRYLIISLPPFLIIIAYGLFCLQKWPRIFAIVVLTILTYQGLGKYYNNARSRGEDWRSLTIFVSSSVDENDGILFHSRGVEHCFNYYSQRCGKAEVQSIIIDQKMISERMVKKYSRIWLVLSHHKFNSIARQRCDYIKGILGAVFSHKAVFEFSGIRLELYSKEPSASARGIQGSFFIKKAHPLKGLSREKYSSCQENVPIFPLGRDPMYRTRVELM